MESKEENISSEKTFGRVKKLEKRVLELENKFEEFETTIYDILQQLEDTVGSYGPIQLSIEKVTQELDSMKAQLDYADSTVGDHNTLDQIKSSLTEIKNALKIR